MASAFPPCSAAAGRYPGRHRESDMTTPTLNKYTASRYESELHPARDEGATCQVLLKIFLLLVPSVYSWPAADARLDGNYSSDLAQRIILLWRNTGRFAPLDARPWASLKPVQVIASSGHSETRARAI